MSQLSKEQIRAIVGRVAAQHNVIIGEDDPAFFFATICAAVTEEALSDASAELDKATGRLLAASDGVQRAAVSRVAEQTKDAVKSIKREREGTVTSVLVQAWPLIAIVGVLTLMLGFVAGRVI